MESAGESDESPQLPDKSRSLRTRSILKRLETERNRNTPRPRPIRQKSHVLSKYRRKAANAKERDRMRNVNDAFERLKDCLPNIEVDANDVKGTKVSTLRYAITYIKSLQGLLEESEAMDEAPDAPAWAQQPSADIDLPVAAKSSSSHKPSKPKSAVAKKSAKSSNACGKRRATTSGCCSCCRRRSRKKTPAASSKAVLMSHVKRKSDAKHVSPPPWQLQAQPPQNNVIKLNVSGGLDGQTLRGAVMAALAGGGAALRGPAGLGQEPHRGVRLDVTQLCVDRDGDGGPVLYLLPVPTVAQPQPPHSLCSPTTSTTSSSSTASSPAAMPQLHVDPTAFGLAGDHKDCSLEKENILDDIDAVLKENESLDLMLFPVHC